MNFGKVESGIDDSGIEFILTLSRGRTKAGETYCNRIIAFLPKPDVFEEEIDRTPKVEVGFENVNPDEYLFPVVTQASGEQLRLLAELAFQDLGIRHPGVMNLFNFALREGVMFDGRN